MLRKIITLILTFFLFNTVLAQASATLLLDWFINPNHAPILVAQQQGFFKKHGLKINIISPADPSDPLKLVAAGQADIGVTYEPDFLVAVSQGLPLVRIGSLINHPLSCLMVEKNGPIKSLADLKGKEIGHSGGNNNQIILRTMLHSAGLNLNDVQLINLRFGGIQALLSNRIDAASGMMRNFEPIEMELSGHPTRLFLPEDYGVPNYDELIFVVNKHIVHDPAFVDFMEAIQEAVNYLDEHPQSCWDNFANANPALNNELNRRAWFATLPYFAKQPSALDLAQYTQYAQFLKQAGVINAMPPIEKYAVDLLRTKHLKEHS